MTKTIRKTAWRGKPKDQTMRGRPLNPNMATADRYYQRLRPLVQLMSETTKRELGKLFREDHAQEYFAQDASISSQARILMNALQKRFDDLFGFKSKGIAETFVNESDRTSVMSLGMSLKELSGGLTINTKILSGDLNEVLNASVTENVGLIKSISAQYLDGVRGAVMRSITTGKGLEDLIPFLKDHEGITMRRAKLIAHDQTRKAFSNINRVRMEKLGVKEFEWLHSAGGQKPRPRHVHLSGQVFRFDDPPVIDEKTGERGLPGQLINCRCRMTPVISFDEGVSPDE